jgi:dihydroxyacetone kinase-like predicted kinase
MIEACNEVTSMAITQANRDSSTPLGNIKQGNYLLIVENEILAFGNAIPDLLEKMKSISDGKEIATLIWGADISSEVKIQILDKLRGLDVFEISGNQDIWLMMAGLE